MAKIIRPTSCIGVLVGVFLLGTAPLRSQTVSYPPYSVTVSVRVEGQPGLRERISSYVTRELRALPGVIVADREPTFVINVVAMETRNRAGTQTGFALSTVITNALNCQVLTQLNSAQPPERKIAQPWVFEYFVSICPDYSRILTTTWL